MAIFYVSTTGNDAANGSKATPWKTLGKAFSTVTSGNTIHVNAGTYTQATQLNLPVGVSLEGDGKDVTIIKSSITGDWSTLLNIESGSVTNGNQTITGITFDGQYVSESNYKTWIGVWNTFRSNVVMDGCKIINFYDRGVIYNGNGDNRSTIPVDPGVYTTGNKIINCVFDNCARNSPNYIAGQVNIGGQKDMLISGNTMTQLTRPAGKNGELVKYWGSGYNPGLKIINNSLRRLNFSSNQYNGSGDWNFAIELFNNTGLEIANNYIQGSIDLNYNRKGGVYTYSFWFHDNVCDHNPVNTREEDGMVLEFESGDFIIENNKFLNQAIGITFNIRTPNNNGGYTNPKPVGGYSAVTNGIIRNNLFANLYSSYSYGNCCGSAGIQFYTEGETKDGYVRNLQIYNNTFVNRNSPNASNIGVDLTHFTASTASTDGITIRNNIFMGFVDTYLQGGSSRMLNTVTRDNALWINGNNNNPSWTGSLTNTGNLVVNPALNTDYTIPTTSPIYGKNIGWSATNTPPPNQAPTSNAGADQTINLPANTVSLVGTGVDVDGTIASYAWSQVSGPAAIIGSPTSASTQISGLVQGTFVFRLTVTDNQGATGTDTVQITVNPAQVPNNPPIVNAGVDQVITLPAPLNLSGSATDSDGTISSYQWSMVSGPNSATFANVTAASTSVTNAVAGTYVFQLRATDNQGASATDTVQVIVNPSIQYQDSTQVIVYAFANNAAALAAGLKVGMLYRTGDTVKVVHN